MDETRKPEEFKRSTGCDSCGEPFKADMEYFERNPPGGYGRDQFMICFDCLRNGEADGVLESFPELREQLA